MRSFPSLLYGAPELLLPGKLSLGGIEVDPSSPLADGLLGFWVPNGATMVDLVTGALAVDRVNQTGTPPGLGATEDASLGIDYSSATQLSGTLPITVAVYITVQRTPVSGGALLAQGTEVVLRFSGQTAFEFILNSFTTNDRVTVTPDAAVAGRSTTVIGTYGGSGSLTCTVDGYKSASVTPTGSYANVASNYYLGNSGSLAGNLIAVHALVISSREWNDADRRMWNEDPFGSILRPVGSRWVRPAAAVGGGGTILPQMIQQGLYAGYGMAA